MEIIFSSQFHVEITARKAYLASSGIETVILDESTRAATGYLPADFRLALVDAQQLEDAERLLAEYKASSEERTDPWTCATCNESNEGSFTDCWKCTSPRPGT